MKKCLIPLILLVLHWNTRADIGTAMQVIPFNATRLITTSDGLSHNSIYCIFKDSRGFMWFGTMDGVNRYDGYEVKSFKNNPFDITTISGTRVMDILEDEEGVLWFATNKGLNQFDRESSTFTRLDFSSLKTSTQEHYMINRLHIDSKQRFWLCTHGGLFLLDRTTLKNKKENLDHSLTFFHGGIVQDIAEDPSGTLWLLDDAPGIHRYDEKNQKFEFIPLESKENPLSERYYDKRFYLDENQVFWIYTGKVGLFEFDTRNQRFQSYNRGGRSIFGTGVINQVLSWEKGIYWIATDGEGIFILDKEQQTLAKVGPEPGMHGALVTKAIKCLYRDNQGLLWVGTTNQGVNIIDLNPRKFDLYKKENPDDYVIGGNNILSLFEDLDGEIWVGTDGDGITRLNQKEGKIKIYNKDNTPAVQSGVILSITGDKNGNIWFGTYTNGLLKFDRKKKNFISISNTPDHPDKLPSNTIWHLRSNPDGSIWVSTHGGGLFRFNSSSGQQERFLHDLDNPCSIAGNFVNMVLEDSKGILWVATAGNGLDRMDPGKTCFTHYQNDPSNETSISDNTVNHIHEDGKGRIWIGTSRGLNLLDPSTGHFQRFFTRDGLPDNSIMAITSDHNGHLWVSSLNGISQVTVNYHENNYSLGIKNFGPGDGLQGKDFNMGAVMRTQSGQILFGGRYGLNAFYPGQVSINPSKPRVALTNLRVFNQIVNPGDQVNGRVILSKNISEESDITLAANQNVFTLEFAALHYANPMLNQYQYILEGFDKSWVSTGANSRVATYTNLNPGKYIFRVRGSNNDGVWSEEEASLIINVLPPWWLSPWAFVGYGLLFILLFTVFMKIIMVRAKYQHQIQVERIEAAKQKEINLLKTNFFTKITHEFRTPLTLILAPVDSILRAPEQVPVKNYLAELKLIKSNGKRLLNLINQILEIRKIESGGIHPKLVENDLLEIIVPVFDSFKKIAYDMNINYRLNSPEAPVYSDIDQDMIEKCLINLLSNAFKFTGEGGTITLSLICREKEYDLIVQDTGTGIPEDKMDLLFEAFYSNSPDDASGNPGIGLGLTLVKEFVEMMNGKVSVSSKEMGENSLDHGTRFTLTLPLTKISSNQQEFYQKSKTPVALDTALLNTLENEGESVVDTRLENTVHILVVEDHEEVRGFLVKELSLGFKVSSAENGSSALELLNRSRVDIIISDVMMPGISGFELCEKVKTNPLTSHVPVILLTAWVAEEKEIKGYSTGADAYIAKPFNVEVLKARVRNLIEGRERIKKAFQTNPAFTISDFDGNTIDKEFLEKMYRVLKQNITAEKLNAEFLGNELGFGRTALYEKVNQLTGQTVNEFIRTYRLREAAKLLVYNSISINEVSYMVGFKNPSHFSRCFAEQFQCSAKEYVKQHKSSTDEQNKP